jgi:hypothetical protein
MTTRTARIIGACLLAALPVVGVGCTAPSRRVATGHQTAAVAAPPTEIAGGTAAGRYRIKTTEHGGATTVILLDTATGRCWATFYAAGQDPNAWVDLKSPAASRRR